MNTSLSAAAASVIESLEPRLAPAGTLLLTTVGNVLTITGDTANNGISVTDSPATGLWTITDPTASGTAFILNGVAQAATFTIPAQNAIKATLGDGNDTLRILPSAAPSGMILTGVLNVNGGKGDDTLSFGTAATQSLQVQGATAIDMGDGTDSLTLTTSALFANTVDVKLGAGTDTVVFPGGGSEHTFLKGLKIDVGAGTTGVVLTSTHLDVSGGNLAISGAGLAATTQTVTLNPDFTTVQGSISVSILAGDVTARLNSVGSDQFRVNGGVTITTGAGDDALLVTGTLMITGALTVDLKEGANGLSMAANSVSQLGAFTFKSGAGADILTLFSGATLDVLGALTLSPGAGDNSFTNLGTSSFVAGSFGYTGGAGDDTLSLSGASYLIRGNATITTGAGTSSVTSAPTGSGAIGGNFLFTGGANFDNLTIDNAFSVGGATTLDLKESQNIVSFDAGSSSVLNSFLQKGGKGTDILDIDGIVTARGAVNFSSGEGGDTFSAGAAGELHAGSFNFTAGATGQTFVMFDGPAFEVAGAAVFNFGGSNNSCNFTALANFSAGSLTVTALGGTDDFLVTAADFDVRGASSMNLGNANNVVNLTLGDGDFNSGFTYTGGTANDIFTFAGSAGDDLRINGALIFKGNTGGNQLLVLTDTAFIGAVNFTGAKDTDLLYLGQEAGTSTKITVLGGVVANMFAGTNEAKITDTVVQGSLLLNSASVTGENDAFVLNQSTFNGPITLNMGADGSSFTLNDSFVRGAFVLNTGAGADNVSLDGAAGSAILSTWFDKVTISTGAGADTIFIGSAGNAGNIFQRAVILDGGADSDTLNEANNTFNGGAPTTSNIP